MAYESQLKNPDVDFLFKAIMTLETEEDCYRFFEDICTIKEIQAIAMRLKVAKMLKDGHTYNEIEEATLASTATISRINKCLLYGAKGYVGALNRIEKSERDLINKQKFIKK